MAKFACDVANNGGGQKREKKCQRDGTEQNMSQQGRAQGNA